MISGIVLIDKPAGWRSRQVVDAVGKALGIRNITADPSPESFASLNDLVQEFDIRIAIHNHGPRHRYNKVVDVAAVKIAGKPAYKYARAGEHVELKPRPVTIHSLQVSRMALPEVEVEVQCSKGTYIRSIAHDLGQALGVGGHLKQIRRTASAPFFVRDAVDLNAFLDCNAEQQAKCIVSLDKALPTMPRIDANED